MTARTYLTLGALALTLALPMRAQAAAEEAPSASSSAASAAAQAPLPELPRLAPIDRKDPSPEALDAVDHILAQLTSSEATARQDAKRMMGDISPTFVPAIRQRVQDLRTALDGKAALAVLGDARKAGRKASKSSKDEDNDGDGDWLDFMLAKPQPKSKTWQQLTQLLAMERMLATVGTTPAVRELIQLQAYFGELVRIDLQRLVAKLRDKAVPALIEARRHDAVVVRRWADKQLDLLGRSTPGEAVGTTDTQVLADVLRAYGRVRDVESVRVLLSFSDNDRVQLREASREAVAAIGEPGLWQLRDAYLAQTGDKAPRAWAWDRLARELFGIQDRARLAEVFKLMDEGTAAFAAKKYTEATTAFDKILARAPLFDRRKEMAPAYVAHADALDEAKASDKLAMLRKALRLDPASPEAKSLQARIAAMEGMELIAKGTPDKYILQRAIELDPSNDAARSALASLQDTAVARQSSMKRYMAAGGVGLVAIIAMILLAWRRSDPAPAPAPPTEPAGGGSP